MVKKINRRIINLSYQEYADTKKNSVKIDFSHGEAQIPYKYSQDHRLIALLKKKEKVKEENILLVAGADSALHHIAETYLEPGKKALIPVPSFPRYEFHTRMMGSKPIFINIYRKSNKTEIINRAAKKLAVDLIFIDSPNNPTGESFSISQLKNIICDNPRVLIILDQVLEKYNNLIASNLIKTMGNILIVKSFSKIYGVPGLRIGYILGPKNLILSIKKTISPYEITSLSLIKAIEILEKKLYAQQIQSEIAKSQKYLRQFLKLKFSKTIGFMALIDGEKILPNLFFLLQRNGIKVVNGRNFRALERSNTVRISLTNFENVKYFVNFCNKKINTFS